MNAPITKHAHICVQLLFLGVTDHDECLVDNGNCEQICDNQISGYQLPGYQCLCRGGYRLDNGTNCIGRHWQMFKLIIKSCL